MFRRIAICVGILTVLTAMILTMALPRYAAANDWTPSDSTGVGDWNDGDNWSEGVPSGADEVYVNYSYNDGEMDYYGNPVIGLEDPTSAQADLLTVNAQNTVSLYTGSTLSVLNLALEGGNFTQTGGTNTVSGNLGIGTASPTVSAEYYLENGTLNVNGNLTSGAKSGGATNTLRIAGGEVNVRGNYDLSAGSGSTDLIQTGGIINMTGTGTVTQGTTNNFYKVSVASNGHTTTAMGSLDTSYLIMGGGTLNVTAVGENRNVALFGVGDVLLNANSDLEDPDDPDRYTFEGTISTDRMYYWPGAATSAPTVNVAGGDYSGVGQLYLINQHKEFDTTFDVKGDIVGNTSGTLYMIQEDNGGMTPDHTAVVKLNGHSVSYGEINVGYYSEGLLYAEANADSGSTMTATTMAIYPGSSLNVASGATVYVSDTLTVHGVLSNNGTIDAGLIDVTGVSGVYSGEYKGSGTLSDVPITIASGGIAAPGNSIGTITSSGTLSVATWGIDGVLEWELHDTGGTAGQDGWDLWKFINGAKLDLTATTTPGDQFLIEIYALGGAGYNFDTTLDDQFKIVDWTAGIYDGFDAGWEDKFTVTSHISGAGSSQWTLSMDSGGLYLNYDGVVPEPSTVVALVFGGFLAVWRRLRKRVVRTLHK